jgi:hypothetical protein
VPEGPRAFRPRSLTGICLLVKPQLIVLRSDPMPEAGMHEPTVVRVEFHDHGDKTRMTLSDGPLSPDGRGHAEAGYHAAFDKLAAHLAG